MTFDKKVSRWLIWQRNLQGFRILWKIKKSVQDDNDDFNGETIHPPIFQMTSFEVTHYSRKLRFIHGQKSFAHYREPKCIG